MYPEDFTTDFNKYARSVKYRYPSTGNASKLTCFR